jgi:hypothetical protein
MKIRQTVWSLILNHKEIDRQKWLSTQRIRPPTPRKGRFNQEVRERNGAWRVTAVLLLSALAVENILCANIWEVLVKLLS